MVTAKNEGNVLFCCTHILLLNYIPSLFYCFCKNNSTGGTWPPRITCKTGQLPLQWDLVIALLSRKSLSGFFYACREADLQSQQCFLSRDGHSVLVHGSEGTDCTLLISTLAQLIMDPCCRTLEGFLALLEREWVQVRVC